jgi:hypothetical protein
VERLSKGGTFGGAGAFCFAMCVSVAVSCEPTGSRTQFRISRGAPAGAKVPRQAGRMGT